MCGILGVVSRNGLSLNDRNWLDDSLQKLSHRGPDSSGIWCSADQRVKLGHTRLSIIDLQSRSTQPLTYKNSLVISFNGEIYNFKELRDILVSKGYSFRTSSDTEVILASYMEWGDALLDKLVGMYSFAIYDSKDESIFIARDRMGEKPFFFSYFNNRLYFSSELRPLLTCNHSSPKISNEGLNLYLYLGYLPDSYCIIDGIKKLPPGHSLKFKLNSTNPPSIQKYWNIPNYVACNVHVDDLIDEFDDIFNQAISSQLVSDVPIGVLLSGGLDSSLITSVAAKSVNQLKTFTISFPSSPHFDESHHAKLIASYFGTNHTNLELDKSDLHVVFDRMLSSLDEPLADTSLLPTYLVSHLVRSNCTVALGGDGGDELFGGYSSYQNLIKMAKLKRTIPPSFTKKMRSIVTNYLPLGAKGRGFIQKFDWDLTSGLPLKTDFFDYATRKSLINSSRVIPVEFLYEQLINNNHHDIIQRATRADATTYLPDDILVKVDRASMMNSLEMRSPFLDKGVVEFAFSKIDSSLKASFSDKKIFLKKYAKRKLPPDFNYNRKQGFSIPLHDWIRSGTFRHEVMETLFASHFFSKKLLSYLFSSFDKGYNNADRILSLYILDKWCNNNGVKL